MTSEFYFRRSQSILWTVLFFFFFFLSFFFSFIFTLLLYFMRFSAPCKMAQCMCVQVQSEFHSGTPFKRCICIRCNLSEIIPGSKFENRFNSLCIYRFILEKFIDIKKKTLIHYFEFQFSMALNLFHSSLVNCSALKYFKIERRVERNDFHLLQ